MPRQTAALPSGIYLTPFPATTSHTTNTPSSSTSTSTTSPSPQPFTDYYAVLGLEIWSTTEDIKAAHRRLRVQYFRTDAMRYQALQAAYAVLVDREARHAYNVLYRVRMGVPPSQSQSQSQSQLKRESTGAVRDAIRAIDAKRGCAPFEIDEGAEANKGMEVKQEVVVVKKEMEVKKEDEKVGDDVEAEWDDNWALKHFNAIYRPVIGMRMYQSYVPMLCVYEGRRKHPWLKCGRPKYMGVSARLARP